MNFAIKWSLVAIISLSMLMIQTKANETHTLATQFIQWMAKHGKDYRSAEEFMYRLSLYSERDAQIEQVLADGIIQRSSIGHNKYSDRSENEMGRKIKVPEVYQNREPHFSSGYSTGWNWCNNTSTDDITELIIVNITYCNAIQDNGDCTKSGGAFATVAAIETMYSYQHHEEADEVISLSVQECIDCAGYSGISDNACSKASTPRKCMRYAAEQALSLNSSYPYTGQNQTCQSETAGPIQIANYTSLTPQNATIVKT